jgi:hypothetical protein
MLTITVNGREEKLNIGCRTFISLDQLLKVLAADDSVVTLNGAKISGNNLTKTIVKGGDSLKLPGLVR